MTSLPEYGVRPDASDEVKGDLIFDIGMNTGEDTDFYLRKGFRVVAVEANPAACAAALERYAAEIAAGRLSIVNAAIADSRETLKFHVCKTLAAWSTTCDEMKARWMAQGAQFETIEVQACTTEDLLQRFGTPYYAKIDIEGADLTCLRGFAGRRSRPAYVSIEVDFYRLDELFACLASLGYRRFALVGQAGLAQQRAPEPALEGRYVAYEFSSRGSGLFGRELPAEWGAARDARRRCDRIVSQHRLCGLVKRLEPVFPARPALKAVRERCFPLAQDWYDLHAAL